MCNNDLITIIIPVYNTEKYLRDCLECVIKQSYVYLEIILINDGSSDNSGKICDAYAQKDKRIRVFHTSNKGISAARNLGILQASGNYIGFIDSDDLIHKDMFKFLYENIVCYSADIATCGTKYVDESTVISSLKETEMSSGDNNDIELVSTPFKILERFLFKYSSKKRINVGVWNKLYKRELVINTLFPEGKYYEDMFWTYKILINCSLLVFSKSEKYFYRQRNGSICNSEFNSNYFDNVVANIERYNYICKNFYKLNRLISTRFIADCKETISLINISKKTNYFIHKKVLMFLIWLVRINRAKYYLGLFINHKYKMILPNFDELICILTRFFEL